MYNARSKHPKALSTYHSHDCGNIVSQKNLILFYYDWIRLFKKTKDW